MNKPHRFFSLSVPIALVLGACGACLALGAVGSRGNSFCLVRRRCVALLPSDPKPFDLAALVVICFLFAIASGVALLWMSHPSMKRRILMGSTVTATAIATVAMLVYSFVMKFPMGFWLVLATLGVVALAALKDHPIPDPVPKTNAGGKLICLALVLTAAACTFAGGRWSSLKRHREYTGLLSVGVDPSLLQRDDAPRYGADRSPVQVVVFSDPVCPACVRNVPGIIAQAKMKGSGFKVTYRQYPLPIHHQARDLSLLEVWASKHGAFDAFRSLIEKHQGDERKIISDLPSIGLREAQAQAVLRGSSKEALACQAVLDKDLQDGKALGVKGTPFFFVVERGLPVRWYFGAPNLGAKTAKVSSCESGGECAP